MSKLPSKKKKPTDIVWFWGNECRYDVIHDKVTALGWRNIDDEKKETRCNIFWIDTATIHERFRSILPWQVINHFPGMPNIARKNRMGQNLNRMQKIYPKEYGFYPRTWVLPGEMADFRTQFDSAGNALGNKMFIIKPDAGCQGKGISLARSWDQIPQQENMVAQVYIKKPLLIDGYKFDLRIYILVTSVKPLRMYLFQDGLVRICTEEYVKPTKANMHQLRMHLTNYAVNKASSNFQQAATDDDEGGSKRSLDWFMSWIRDEYGESKANWLWKRFGVLAVRTVLSILPTLSREYDLYFKQFSNVPVHPPPSRPKEGAANAKGSLVVDKLRKREKKDKKASASSSGDEGCAEDEDEAEEEEEDDGETETGKEGATDTERRSTGAEGEGGEGTMDSAEEVTAETEDASTKDGESDWRGSRCFEVLGIDVMVDSHLKPWLIEFNHLPSFGTDSPLDLDIKGRLMEEVFDIIPVRPDDEQMFTLYHKMEAERRLLAERTTASSSKVREKANMERERKEEADRLGRERWSRKRAEMLKEREREMERQRGLQAAAAAARLLEMEAEELRVVEHQLQMDRLEAQQRLTDPVPVGPERYEEIKLVLSRVYEQYCPNKMGKIDKLLAKYIGREEEFVAFVFDKYEVPYERMAKYRMHPSESAQEEKDEPAMTSMTVHEEGQGKEEAQQGDAEGAQDDGEVQNGHHEPSASIDSQDQQPQRTTEQCGASTRTDRSQQKSVVGRDGRKANRGSDTRSASPPNRRNAAWRGVPDDDETFKAEVLAQHVPKPGDKWLEFEKDKLQSFFRIFPVPDPLSGNADPSECLTETKDTVSVAGEDEEGEEEEEDGEGGMSGDVSETEMTPGNAVGTVSIKKKKTASFEEILCHVFLQDRRQTLRLKAPLGSNRSKSFDRAQSSSKDKDSDSQSLPALSEPFRAGGSKAQSQQGQRSLPGWRPPPPRDRREPPKHSTQHQIDIANKLSKGLSSLANGEEQTTKPRASKMIVSAKHRVYTNTSGSSGSAAGAVYTHHPQFFYSQDVGNEMSGRGGIAYDGYLDQGSNTSVGSVPQPGALASGRGESDVYSAMMNSLQQSSVSGPSISRQGSVNKISSNSAAPLRQQTFAFDNGVTPNTIFGESNDVLRKGGMHRR